MADYCKIYSKVLYTTSSDFSGPNLVQQEDTTETLSSPTKRLMIKVSAATGGTTVELGSFTTIDELSVRNLDTTNYVTAVSVNAAGTATVKVPRNPQFPASLATAASDLVLTANTAACLCEVIVIGT